MSLLREEIENTTTVIGVETKDGVRWVGTGFFVEYHNPTDNSYYIYLVTNKHVIINQNKIIVRLVLKSGLIKNFDIDLYGKNKEELFSAHPIKEVDVVVIQLMAPVIKSSLKKINAFLIGKNTFTAQEYIDNGGFEGSPIFMLGYPLGIIDEYSTTPICRKGCIARFKIDEIKNKHTFLLDLQNFPGNSGSPIISCAEIVALEGTNAINKAALIGIVHAYIPYQEELMSTQTQKIVEIRTENSGIAIAFPTDCIIELVESDLITKGLLKK